MRKRLDLTGQRYGQLTVIEPTETIRNRTYWYCQCDCGKVHRVATHELRSGKVKSCGCKRGNAPKNIEGVRFGRLVALHRLKKKTKKGSIYWLCKCDCGKQVEVCEQSLVSGNTKSCGCLKISTGKQLQNRLHYVEGTCIELLKTTKVRRDNKTGHRGVVLLKNGRYKATLGFQGKQIILGVFDNLKDAVEARKLAEKHYYEPLLKQTENNER